MRVDNKNKTTTIPKSFADRRHQRWLEPDLVLVDTVYDGLGDAHGAVRVLDRGHIHWLPGNWGLGSGENFLNSNCDLWSNAIARYQGYCSGLTENNMFSKKITFTMVNKEIEWVFDSQSLNKCCHCQPAEGAKTSFQWGTKLLEHVCLKSEEHRARPS